MEKWIVFSNERVWAFFSYFSSGRFGQDGAPVCAVIFMLKSASRRGLQHLEFKNMAFFDGIPGGTALT